MNIIVPIHTLTSSLNSAVFGGDGGRLCVMGGGCIDAAELGREGRSCFYSCLGCFQLEIGNRKQQGQLGRTTFRGVRANLPARRRNADRKGGVSALVSGLSKSFQRMRIEEKGHNTHEGDAMVVKPRLLVGVSGDYDFAEVVVDVSKGKCFLFPFRMVWDGKCRLDVNAFGCLVHNEIDFITPDFMLAGRSCSVYRYIAYVNRISSHCKLVEDCVFHKVRPFVLSEVETGVAEPAICGIVFERGSDVSTAFDIITHCLGYYECVCQIVNVFAYGDSVRLHAHDCVECVRDFARVGKTANSAHHDGHKRIKHFIAFETVPFNDIAQVNCFVEERWLFKSCEDTSFVKGGCSGCFRPKIRSAA